jgi:hypothetical protein
MAPFIVNHPTLLHNWIYCREKALKEIRSIEEVNAGDFKFFKECLTKSKLCIDTWLTDSQYQIDKINSLKTDIIKFTQHFEKNCSVKIKYLWNKIYVWAGENLGGECIEYIVSMMMEPYDNIINPLIKQLNHQGFNLTGSVPADTAFTPDALKGVDCVLAMYHDQGLPVLKTLGFKKAVNITLGLPFIRTSVDHGTALDLAGTGNISLGSLHTALDYAQNFIDNQHA